MLFCLLHSSYSFHWSDVLFSLFSSLDGHLDRIQSLLKDWSGHGLRRNSKRSLGAASASAGSSEAAALSASEAKERKREAKERKRRAAAARRRLEESMSSPDSAMFDSCRTPPREGRREGLKDGWRSSFFQACVSDIHRHTILIRFD